MIQLQSGGDPKIVYHGSNLKQDLLKAYRAGASGCVMKYTNSHGDVIKLTLLEIKSRLFLLSFDPYHCPELRWGASGKELSTCLQETSVQKTKIDWYTAEKHLRNQPQRNYNQQMNYRLVELQLDRDVQQGVGLASPPDVCVEEVLGAGPCQ